MFAFQRCGKFLTRVINESDELRDVRPPLVITGGARILADPPVRGAICSALHGDGIPLTGPSPPRTGPLKWSEVVGSMVFVQEQYVNRLWAAIANTPGSGANGGRHADRAKAKETFVFHVGV